MTNLSSAPLTSSRTFLPSMLSTAQLFTSAKPVFGNSPLRPPVCGVANPTRGEMPICAAVLSHVYACFSSTFFILTVCLQESRLSMTFAEPPSFLGGRCTPPAQKQLTPAEEMRIYCGYVRSRRRSRTGGQEHGDRAGADAQLSSSGGKAGKDSERPQSREGGLEREREGREQRRPQATLRAWIEPKPQPAGAPCQSSQPRDRATTDAQFASECLSPSSPSRRHPEPTGPRHPIHPLLQQQSRWHAGTSLEGRQGMEGSSREGTSHDGLEAGSRPRAVQRGEESDHPCGPRRESEDSGHRTWMADAGTCLELSTVGQQGAEALHQRRERPDPTSGSHPPPGSSSLPHLPAGSPSSVSCQKEPHGDGRCSSYHPGYGCWASDSAGTRDLRYHASPESIGHHSGCWHESSAGPPAALPTGELHPESARFCILQLKLRNPSNLCYMHSVVLSWLWCLAVCPISSTQVPEWIAMGLRRILQCPTLQLLYSHPTWCTLMQEWESPHRQHDAAEFVQYLHRRMLHPAPDFYWQARTTDDRRIHVEEAGCSPVICLPLSSDSLLDVQSLLNAWHTQAGIRALNGRTELVVMQLARYRDDCSKREDFIEHQSRVAVPVFVDLHTTHTNLLYFRLQAICIHLGTQVTSGHYQAILYDHQSCRSHLTDDNTPAVSISYASTVQRFNRSSYLLFYVLDNDIVA